jgi:hypothetical protein
VTGVNDEFYTPFEGAVTVTGGGGESQQRRSPSLIGQSFARSSPTLVAARESLRTRTNKDVFVVISGRKPRYTSTSPILDADTLQDKLLLLRAAIE